MKKVLPIVILAIGILVVLFFYLLLDTKTLEFGKFVQNLEGESR